MSFTDDLIEEVKSLAEEVKALREQTVDSVLLAAPYDRLKSTTNVDGIIDRLGQLEDSILADAIHRSEHE